MSDIEIFIIGFFSGSIFLGLGTFIFIKLTLYLVEKLTDNDNEQGYQRN